MPKQILQLGVLAESRPPATRWGERQLHPSGLLPQVPTTAPGTLLSNDGGVQLWYLGARALVLHSGDTGYYRDNLAAARPSVWVALQQPQDPAKVMVQMITADPYEGEGLAGDTSLLVEAVTMPDALRRTVAAFIDAHHVEIAFKKRKRQDARTDDPRAPRILAPGQKWQDR